GLRGDRALASRVDYAPGTCSLGSADFPAQSGSVWCSAGWGARMQTVSVPIANDTLYEKSEQFYLNLTNPTEAKIADPQGVGTIRSEERRAGETKRDRPSYKDHKVTVNEDGGNSTLQPTRRGDSAR